MRPGAAVAAVAAAWTALGACTFAGRDLALDAAAPDAARPDAARPCDLAGCPGACEETSTGPACVLPATCAEAQRHGAPPDAPTPLYVDGDRARPWLAYCDGDREYLPVPAATNFGQYTAGGSSPGTSRRTSYAMLRLDPSTLRVDVADARHATSVGGPMTHGQGGPTVDVLPVGVAIDCVAHGSSSGRGGVDLTGTPFVVTSRFLVHGYMVAGSATPASPARRIALTGGGYCGYEVPEGYAVDRDRYFNRPPGDLVLQLGYAP